MVLVLRANLTMGFTSSNLLWECFNALGEVAPRSSVHLNHVQDRVVVDGNEFADELAKRGAGMPFVGPEPCCGICKATANH